MGLDALIASWSRFSASTHLKAEIAHAFHVRAGEAAALGRGQAVPGCRCASCAPDEETTPQRGRRRVSEEEIRTARAAPILQVLEALGLDDELERVRGDEWRLLCPVHEERTPSCFVNVEKNVWNCFGCGAGGNSLDLALAVTERSFSDAVEWLRGFFVKPLRGPRLLVPTRMAREPLRCLRRSR